MMWRPGGRLMLAFPELGSNQLSLGTPCWTLVSLGHTQPSFSMQTTGPWRQNGFVRRTCFTSPPSSQFCFGLEICRPCVSHGVIGICCSHWLSVKHLGHCRTLPGSLRRLLLWRVYLEVDSEWVPCGFCHVDILKCI